MRILFVSSGRSGDVGILVKNQAETLIKEGVEIDFFTIKSNGFWGYLKSVKSIRKTFLSGNYDLIHAHYSLSAFPASLAGQFPLVVSLMGSDAYLSGLFRLCARLFYYIRWDNTIVKTERMKALLKMPNAIVLPNGVDTERYIQISKDVARNKIGYTMEKKLIVFVADPNREEKNFTLAQEAFALLKNDNVELLPVYNKPNYLIPYYLNAANVLLLTSKWEGSVNVVKEAMACNLPIVSTDVGDVKNNISDIEGCYISKSEPHDVCLKLKDALEFEGKTNGREKIISLGLDSVTVAKNIKKIYEDLLEKQ